MAESFNIRVMTTAAESPWSNGLREHHNAILTEMLLKIKEASVCDLNTALSVPTNQCVRGIPICLQFLLISHQLLKEQASASM